VGLDEPESEPLEGELQVRVVFVYGFVLTLDESPARALEGGPIVQVVAEPRPVAQAGERGSPSASVQSKASRRQLDEAPRGPQQRTPKLQR